MKRSALRSARAIELAASRVARPIVLWGGGVALALAIGMLLHAVASAGVENDARRRFDNLARGAQERLDQAIASYARAVRAMAALHAAGGGNTVPDRAAFHRYAAALDLANNYPAIEALTYATRVPDNERDAFVAAMRADHSVDARGYPDFKIFPAGRRPWYEVVTYQYPPDRPSRRLGFDMASRPLVARALADARDSGAMVASGQPVFLTEPVPHYALGMRLPVYVGGVLPLGVDERRAAYLG